MSTLPSLGQGDEYDMRTGERVVTDRKVIEWRRDQLTGFGFELADADRLSVRADVVVRDVEKWIAAGASCETVLAIVQPD